VSRLWGKSNSYTSSRYTWLLTDCWLSSNGALQKEQQQQQHQKVIQRRDLDLTRKATAAASKLPQPQSVYKD
jgi:hypothetical protein